MSMLSFISFSKTWTIFCWDIWQTTFLMFGIKRYCDWTSVSAAPRLQPCFGGNLGWQQCVQPNVQHSLLTFQVSLMISMCV